MVLSHASNQTKEINILLNAFNTTDEKQKEAAKQKICELYDSSENKSFIYDTVYYYVREKYPEEADAIHSKPDSRKQKKTKTLNYSKIKLSGKQVKSISAIKDNTPLYLSLLKTLIRGLLRMLNYIFVSLYQNYINNTERYC